jgi:hypothetical protein
MAKIQKIKLGSGIFNQKIPGYYILAIECIGWNIYLTQGNLLGIQLIDWLRA